MVSIESRAFNSCSSLEEIVGGKGITTIRDNVFAGSAYALNPDNAVDGIIYWGDCIVGCTGVSGELTIKDGVVLIADCVFQGQPITALHIPASVQYIGEDILMDCRQVESITVAAENKAYRSENNCLIDAANGTLILGCKNSVIPTDASVTSIGRCAFYGAEGLTAITIPGNIKSVGMYAFRDCINLETVVLEEGVTELGYYSFLYCKSLKNINLPSSITTFGTSVFGDCTALESIVIPGRVREISFHMFEGCTNLKEVILPSGLSAIRENAFDGCSSLTTIVIPEKISAIRENAFAGCDNLMICFRGSSLPKDDVALWNPDGRPVVLNYVCDRNGHTFENGVCTACKVAAPEEQ